jgi:hypothetical protein
MRRLLSMFALTVASAAVLVGGLSAPASAAPINEFNDVTVTGWMHVKDDERRRDDIDDYNLTTRSVRLVDLDPAETMSWRQCHGGEIRVELDIRATRLADRPGWVRITATGRLFEKTSCNNSDREDSATITFDVAPNTTSVEKKIHVETSERRSDDYANIHFEVHNYHNRAG